MLRILITVHAVKSAEVEEEGDVWVSLGFLSPQPDMALVRSSHLSLNREGRWGTAEDFAISFLHFPLFSTALWDLASPRPVHSLKLSSHLFHCLP